MFTEIIKDKWENKNKNDKAAIELWNSKADYFGSYELENVQNERFIQIIKENNLINKDSFILGIDGNYYNLESQIIKKNRDIVYITEESKVEIFMKKNLINEVCDYPENNSLYIMLLSGNLVKYDDEGRTKQRHIATWQIYKGVLDDLLSSKSDYYCYDLSNFIKEYKKAYSIDSPNNVFFTTAALRDYHYTKQKENAYYHIQAINLPFQNIEFYYLDK